MLILDEKKEHLLVQKYNFVASTGFGNSKFYRYKKGLTICSHNLKNSEKPQWAGKVEIHSGSKEVQDILYTLIKDDVLLKVKNENNEERIKKLQNKIKELQERIDKIQNTTE